MEKAGTKTTMKEITKKEHENNRQKERNRVENVGEKKEGRKGGIGKKRRKMYKECRSTFASLAGPPILDCPLDLL